MIILFFARVILLFFLYRYAFSPLLAGLATVFLLFETFSTYTGMQIRPDSLMLLFFTIGLFFHTASKKELRLRYAILSGIFYAASVAVLPKIVFVVLCAGLVFLVMSIHNKQWKLIRGFFAGAAITTIATILFFVLQGSFTQVIQQIVFDAPKLFKNFQFGVFWGFFYRPDNPALFGATGKPLSFVFSWLLLFLSGAGFFAMIENFAKKTFSSWQKELLAVMFLGFISQFIWHLSLQSLFLQYYLSLTWIYVFFASFAIVHLLQQINLKIQFKKITMIVLIASISIFMISIIQTNISRSKIRSDALLNAIKTSWRHIPEDKAAFPSVLYRPLGYIFPYKSNFADLPAEFIASQPDLKTTLIERQVEYISNDEYLLRFIPNSAQTYIQENFILSSDGLVYKKKK
jgi:4-amino-4-deoxy-L-arabinose transferase-like glycosyltransferase